jgi:hypothetical protein
LSTFKTEEVQLRRDADHLETNLIVKSDIEKLSTEKKVILEHQLRSVINDVNFQARDIEALKEWIEKEQNHLKSMRRTRQVQIRIFRTGTHQERVRVEPFHHISQPIQTARRSGPPYARKISPLLQTEG